MCYYICYYFSGWVLETLASHNHFDVLLYNMYTNDFA